MKTFSHFQPKSVLFPLPYLLTRPDEDREKKLPLIVFLHGAGERGDDEMLLRVHGIPKYFAEDPAWRGISAVTLSPQCPPDRTWVEFSDAIMELIEKIIAEENIDRQRISVTGLSMGGFGTWEMLCKFPRFFSAAAPICGGGMNWRINTDTPVRAFHGDTDQCVPCAYSYLMADALNAAGGYCELTVYHGCDHDSWTRTYLHTDVISWLASASRPGEEA